MNRRHSKKGGPDDAKAAAFVLAVQADLRREDELASVGERAQAAALVAATLTVLATSDSRASSDATPTTPVLRLVPPLPAARRSDQSLPVRSERATARGHRSGLRLAAAAAAMVVIGLGGLAMARLWTRAHSPAPAASAPVASAGPTTPVNFAAPSTPDAAQLFAWARDARVEGHATNTKRLYEELWARFPTMPEAIAGRAILGRWLLDRGEPGAALPVLADYLRAAPDGPLTEEVRVGIAECWDRLGRTSEARAAWSAIVTHHPASPNARRARDRLSALDAGRGP